MAGKRVIPPSKQNIKGISDKISVPENPDTLSVSFSKFKLDPICLRGKFNNHFKDNQQYISIVTSLLSVVLPKITSHSYGEVCEGSNEGRQLHFHTIDDKHRKIVREILKEYSFSDIIVDQMQIASPNGHLCHIRRPLCDLNGGHPRTH